MATIELAQLPIPAHLGGSDNFSIQSANNHVLRRRRLPELGYAQADHSVSEPLDKLARFREIAAVIVALNVSTLNALQDGWYGSPQVIGRCCDEYACFLSDEEERLVYAIAEAGGAHFEDSILEHVNSMNLEQARGCLVDPQTSKFYSQLVDIRIKKYRASQAHAALAVQANHGTILSKFSSRESYQDYIEHAVTDEYEQRSLLRYAVKAAQRLLSTIKVAVEGGHLQHSELEILKSKVAALQVHYRDAAAAVDEKQSILFYPSADDWWEPPSATGNNDPPVKVAKAYEGRLDVVKSNLILVIPAICLLSCIPTALAWIHSDPNVGTVGDANFYQLVAGSVVQLLGLGTMIYPTVFHSRLARTPWFWTWFLATVSLTCTVLSIPFYVLFPTAWSMVIAFTGTVAQPLILLQIIQAV
ncbi:hypothetical protein HD806DRAFT_515805 [Xylariaceae sp. AK1471]|nr:hypothetical protein HD806DRAFT_515805 [Xylariaceae sp. AK1471]